uniref:Serpin domain-containing protein n=1 Tax=Panagrolaimus sp. PS1159 TaxID=55785 RepID=A0AC35FPA0_9BILA
MVHVTIPKFKTESSFELPRILKEFGIIDASKADLSEISETSLFVSNIIHKAVIEVTRTVPMTIFKNDIKTNK